MENTCGFRLSKAEEPVNIRSKVAASAFQDRIVDFNDALAHADPRAAATIKLKTKIVFLIGMIRSASACCGSVLPGPHGGIAAQTIHLCKDCRIRSTMSYY